MSDRLEARVVRSGDAPTSRGDVFELRVGIGPQTGPTKTLFAAVWRGEPGSKVPPHTHTCETAVYVLRGRAALHIGDDLSQRFEIGPGDWGYVPAGVVHDEQTLGDEPLEVVLARDEQGGETIPVDPADPGWAALRGGD